MSLDSESDEDEFFELVDYTSVSPLEHLVTDLAAFLRSIDDGAPAHHQHAEEPITGGIRECHALIPYMGRKFDVRYIPAQDETEALSHDWSAFPPTGIFQEANGTALVGQVRRWTGLESAFLLVHPSDEEQSVELALSMSTVTRSSGPKPLGTAIVKGLMSAYGIAMREVIGTKKGERWLGIPMFVPIGPRWKGMVGGVSVGIPPKYSGTLDASDQSKARNRLLLPFHYRMIHAPYVPPAHSTLPALIPLLVDIFGEDCQEVARVDMCVTTVKNVVEEDIEWREWVARQASRSDTSDESNVDSSSESDAMHNTEPRFDEVVPVPVLSAINPIRALSVECLYSNVPVPNANTRNSSHHDDSKTVDSHRISVHKRPVYGGVMTGILRRWVEAIRTEETQESLETDEDFVEPVAGRETTWSIEELVQVLVKRIFGDLSIWQLFVPSCSAKGPIADHVEWPHGMRIPPTTLLYRFTLTLMDLLNPESALGSRWKDLMEEDFGFERIAAKVWEGVVNRVEWWWETGEGVTLETLQYNPEEYKDKCPIGVDTGQAYLHQLLGSVAWGCWSRWCCSHNVTSESNPNSSGQNPCTKNDMSSIAQSPKSLQVDSRVDEKLEPQATLQLPQTHDHSQESSTSNLSRSPDAPRPIILEAKSWGSEASWEQVRSRMDLGSRVSSLQHQKSLDQANPDGYASAGDLVLVRSLDSGLSNSRRQENVEDLDAKLDDFDEDDVFFDTVAFEDTPDEVEKSRARTASEALSDYHSVLEESYHSVPEEQPKSADNPDAWDVEMSFNMLGTSPLGESFIEIESQERSRRGLDEYSELDRETFPRQRRGQKGLLSYRLTNPPRSLLERFPPASEHAHVYDIYEPHTVGLPPALHHHQQIQAGYKDIGAMDLLLSDMMAFKAANPYASLADFVRWHSPKDWIADEKQSTHTQETVRETHPYTTEKADGHLSQRMMSPNSPWHTLWASACQNPAPAAEQALTRYYEHNVTVDIQLLKGMWGKGVLRTCFVTLLDLTMRALEEFQRAGLIDVRTVRQDINAGMECCGFDATREIGGEIATVRSVVDSIAALESKLSLYLGIIKALELDVGTVSNATSDAHSSSGYKLNELIWQLVTDGYAVLPNDHNDAIALAQRIIDECGSETIAGARREWRGVSNPHLDCAKTSRDHDGRGWYILAEPGDFRCVWYG
ncbi:hypothetical protein HDU85_004629 [Gaertneriomyces sp. JEL0708]|nr:hypothetical protein HDU85_004629 [Gaertneriomyces sp. JEL0708]